jgi:hypothetical protein
MGKHRLRRRYGRSSIPLAPGQKPKLAVDTQPAGSCAFTVRDQLGNVRGYIEFSREGYRFVDNMAVKGAWVKTKMQALGEFKKFVRRSA